MSDERQVFFAELTALRQENARLKAEVARLLAALEETLARIGELEVPLPSAVARGNCLRPGKMGRQARSAPFDSV